jgi:hypothetical protein
MAAVRAQLLPFSKPYPANSEGTTVKPKMNNMKIVMKNIMPAGAPPEAIIATKKPPIPSANNAIRPA